MRKFWRRAAGPVPHDKQQSESITKSPTTATNRTNNGHTITRFPIFKRAVQRLKCFFSSHRHGDKDIDDTKNVDKQSNLAPLPAASSSSGPTPKSSPNLSDSSNDDIDEELWCGPVRPINNSDGRVLVLRLVAHHFGQHCFVSDVKEYNRVFFVKFLITEMDVYVKVPATGWPARWCPQEAQRLRCEALALRYMRQRLGHSFPSPDCLSYDIKMDNEIKASYILMTTLPGKPGHTIWDDLDPAVKYDEENREKRRCNVLRSLACHMEKMRIISFDAIKVVDFENNSCDTPYIVPQLMSDVDIDATPDHLQPRSITWEEMPVLDSTHRFFEGLLNKNPLTEEWFDGARQTVLSQVPGQLPKSLDDCSAWEERFSLAHPDLDLQTVLCDEEGNVTGTIDWDEVSVKPHFLGCCTIPIWIRKDYDVDFDAWPFNNAYIASLIRMHQWRCIYSKALGEAIGLHKDILCEEEELLPPNYGHMSHLAYPSYDGLLTSGRHHNQLRDFCDHITSVLFRALQLLSVYRGLASIESDEDGSPTSLSHWIFRRLGDILRDGRPKEISWTTLSDRNSEAVRLVNNDDDEDIKRAGSSESIEDNHQPLDAPDDYGNLTSKTDLVCCNRPSTVKSASSVSSARSKIVSELSNDPNDSSSTTSLKADDDANDPANSLPLFTDLGSLHSKEVSSSSWYALSVAGI